MAKKLPVGAILTGAAAAVAYKAIRGDGVFNLIKYRAEHTAVRSYLRTHYPGAHYSLIAAKSGDLYALVNTGQRNFRIKIICLDDGRFLFDEEIKL